MTAQNSVHSFRFPWYGYPGLGVIVISEVGLFFNLWFFETYITPLCWTGLILFLDALNFRLAGNSIIQNHRKEFLWMVSWSIALWYVFEFYNLFIKNWHYVGLPDSLWLRYFGYFWSFATIWPGVYQIFHLLKNLKIFDQIRIKPWTVSKRYLTTSIIFGFFCLLLPFIVSREIAPYLAAPVWIGMVFLLDPINFLNRRYSLLRDWAAGNLTTLLQLFLSGLIAGGLWEFWNYWATAKWIYTVPILGDVKIFEMPVLGYLGFPAFAVEVMVMWESVKLLLRLK
ncbi:MAG: hypothetical protein A2Y94_02695 [Caldithrix sp. RBG_13_44_9]|nr:MAG: hypothetical protein A2Y94_02695 [Caldithrix sp. RBG_13_44_9]